MIKHTIDRKNTNQFSDLANDLVYSQSKWKAFLSTPFSLSAFSEAMASKQHFSQEQRQLLAEVLSEQYTKFGFFSSREIQINALKESNTFTVTTGHQLCIYTGPLYFVYKIAHTISLAKALKKAYPEFNFVPVYWMASEDHDFEEVNHLTLFNQGFHWESNQKGAVGNFSLTDFQGVKAEIAEKFQNDDEMSNWIKRHYEEGHSLAEATFRLVHDLFSDSDLLVIEPNNSKLKASFAPIISNELTTKFSEKAVVETSERLNECGVKVQVNPREINLFYLDEQGRHRIVQLPDDAFEINGKSISRTNLLEEVDCFPERFSPNVVLRPLYQEFVLPNLAYIGGGSEIAYWLQLKGVFDAVGVPFPLIQVRNSIQIIDAHSLSKLQKLDIGLSELFESVTTLQKQYILKNASEELNFNSLEEAANQLVEGMEELIVAVDQGLEGYAKSETVKIHKQLEQLKAKMIRHQKKKHEDAMNQIAHLKSKLFPNEVLQERKENMLAWMAKMGKKEFLAMILSVIDPFETDLILLVEEDFK